MTRKERWSMSEREKEKGEGWREREGEGEGEGVKNVPDSHGVYWRGKPSQADQTRSKHNTDRHQCFSFRTSQR